MTDEIQGNQNVQANDNSVAVGSLAIGGSIDGSLIIGNNNVVGFTSNQVSTLISQISTTFQVKPFNGRCPYKGLETFQEKDAELFFGRERLVDDLISRVKESRAVFITGSSGSGKSSLARAGLLPALKKSGMFGGWLYTTMKPGRDPFEALASCFSRLKDPSLGKYFRENAGQASTLHECAESALTDDEDQRLVLFIDQFEEIFTQLSRDKTEAFINLLDHAATVESGRVIALFSMRSDFIPNCQTYPKLNALLGQKYAFAPIGAMQNDELVSAIAQPALRVGLRIDPDLIAQIINDMEGEPGALPLMQFALKDLFDAQQEKGNIIALTLSDYMARGGIHKALERHADHTFASLSAPEQELARSIFSGLIEVGRGTQDTKRTAIFDELIPANAQRSDVESIIHKLADARLITTDEVGGKTTVTISHEKLISSWTWLKKLVDENRDALAVQIEINNDAKEWDEHQRDDSFLYRGARLANASEKLEAKQLALSGLAMEFIEAGEKAYTDALEQEKKRADHLEALNRISLARQLTAQAQSILGTQYSNKITAVLLAVQSMKLFPSAEAAGVLLNSGVVSRAIPRITHDNHVESVAFSPDGKYVVSGSWDNTARVWKVNKEIIDITYDGNLNSVAYSPDIRYVVTGSDDNTVRLWETAQGREIACMTHDEYVTAVAFSPDGKFVVSGSGDNTARVWEAVTGREMARMIHDHRLTSVAFSPDARYIVSAGWDNIARVWEAATGKELARITHDEYVSSVSFSPDGKFVVSGSGDNTARVWEAETGREMARMTHGRGVIAVAFSSDANHIFSASLDDTVIMWEAQSGKELNCIILLKPIDGEHDGDVNSVAFSPDGRFVVSGGYDYTDNSGEPGTGIARVFETSTGSLIAQKGHARPVDQVTFSPDGNYIVSRSPDTTVVWEVQTGNTVASIENRDGIYVRYVAITPDGRHMTFGRGNAAALWETFSREIARMTHDDHVTRAAFSPDGKYVVSGSYDNTARVWEAETGREVSRMTHNSIVESVAFSPDGKYMVSGSGDWTNNDYTVRVWELTTGNEVTQMTHEAEVISVAFSPDGKYVSSGSKDHTARVWVAGTGKEVARVTHDDSVTGIAFSPDGKFVISGSHDHTARLWESETGREIARMSHDDYVWTVAFSPDGKYVASGGADKTARVWETETGKEVARITLDETVSTLAYSPDGKFIILGSDTACVWEVATGKKFGNMIYENGVRCVAFSMDGKWVVTGGDNIAQAWMWQHQDLIENISAIMPRNLTRAEWQQNIGDALPYQAVCENLPIEPEPTQV